MTGNRVAEHQDTGLRLSERAFFKVTACIVYVFAFMNFPPVCAADVRFLYAGCVADTAFLVHADTSCSLCSADSQHCLHLLDAVVFQCFVLPLP